MIRLCENITLLEFATAPSPARVKVVSWMKGAKGKQRDNTAIARKFRAFIEHSDYPCLGAKTALNKGARPGLISLTRRLGVTRRQK